MRQVLRVRDRWYTGPKTLRGLRQIILGFSAGAELICVSTITPLFRMALCTTSLESLATTHKGLDSWSTFIALQIQVQFISPWIGPILIVIKFLHVSNDWHSTVLHDSVDFDWQNQLCLCRNWDQYFWLVPYFRDPPTRGKNHYRNILGQPLWLVHSRIHSIMRNTATTKQNKLASSKLR